MIFLLKEIINHHLYNVGAIVAENPELAAKKIGRKIYGKDSGPNGQEYFDPTGKAGQSPYLTMNSMPEINSAEQLQLFCQPVEA